jgi:hypothetical protein
MNEQELRAMIRESIARHLPGGASPADAPPGYLAHAAFIRLPLVRGGDDDGACLIEPTVRCNHCGYCQSFGH